MPHTTLTDDLHALAAEMCGALSLYAAALTEPGGVRLTDISECARRCASLAADTHTGLLNAFCPPLPRSHSVLLCEWLHAVVEAVLGASMLLPPDGCANACFSTELASLCRMGELLRHEIDVLARRSKGKSTAPPDTYAYHAELTRARAAHAMHLAHIDRHSTNALVCVGLREIREALAGAYAALLALVAEL